MLSEYREVSSVKRSNDPEDEENQTPVNKKPSLSLSLKKKSNSEQFSKHVTRVSKL